jgi:cyanobactin maturation PatA/PatG family protease
MKIPQQSEPIAPSAAATQLSGRISPSAGAWARAAASDSAPAPVYALGTLGYDFGTTAQRDFFVQNMAPDSPFSRNQLLAYLNANPLEAEAVIWTLNLDETPICALRPGGAYARAAYAQGRRFLSGLPDDDVTIQLSVPGVVVSTATLLAGQVVPAIDPVLQGIYSWSADALVDALKNDGIVDATEEQTIREVVAHFQRRAYQELRNRGQTAQERAMNYAATRAYQEKAYQFKDDHLELSTIVAQRSPICRPGSDCWDVRLTLFDSTAGIERPKRVYQVIVDVSEPIPVLIGGMSEWLKG